MHKVILCCGRGLYRCMKHLHRRDVLFSATCSSVAQRSQVFGGQSCVPCEAAGAAPLTVLPWVACWLPRNACRRMDITDILLYCQIKSHSSPEVPSSQGSSFCSKCPGTNTCWPLG